ncbi:MAG: FtsX-like permease family protein [Thermoproteota archaeon]
MKKAIEVSLISILLVILSINLAIPVFKDFFTPPSENIVDKVTYNFAPFDYFYLSQGVVAGNWSYIVDSFENGNMKIYYDPSYDSNSWKSVSSTFLLKATGLNYSIWVRKTFKVPEIFKDQYLRIVFEGVWGICKVWLNGFYLGEHHSYFSPFFFDIDNIVKRGEDNVLTLYIESPVQDSYNSRVYLVGPYSFSEVFPNVKHALIGVWRDVVLIGTGEVAVNLFLINVKQYSNPVPISVRTLMQNRKSSEESLRVVLRIMKPDSISTILVEQSFDVKLSAGERKWVTLETFIENPAFWNPWDTGFPNIYLANISLYSINGYAGSIQTIFGIRDLEASFSSTGAYIKINGINTFLRGGSYFTRFYPLSNLSSETSGTLNMLREANVNFIRTFAHVAPKELYYFASLNGLIVQADFPLLGSYPSLDSSQQNLEMLKMQLVEFLLLTYNYPSVVIACLHTLPPWANEKSPYYSHRINYRLDMELNNIAKTMVNNLIILPYSGYYDKYVTLGWGTGSWADYLNYKEVFPNIVVPIGLPDINSTFWSFLKTPSYGEAIKILVEKGLDVNLLASYWPETLNLSEIIELSNSYQALTVKSAIDRARILRNGFSMGVSLFSLVDYLGVTGSVIDRYGLRRRVYEEIRNAFNPVHTIILVDGDYRNNLTSLYFAPGSIVRINLWVVNDALKDQANAVLSWRMKDLSSGELMTDENIVLEMPPLSRAVLVKKQVFEVPYCTDAEHILEVSTTLVLENGTVLDSNSQRFIVKPTSLIRISLEPPPSRPQLFLVHIDNSYRVFKVDREEVLMVPSGVNIEIIGPSLNREEVYVPRIISLGTLSPGEMRNVKIVMLPGAIARVLVNFPSIIDSSIPSQEVYISLIGGNNSGLLLYYTPQKTPILNLLNISGNIVILPAEENVSILVLISSPSGRRGLRIGNSTQPIRLRRNSEVQLDQPALAQVELNQQAVRDTLASAEKSVNRTMEAGFYVGLELYRLRRAMEQYSSALNTSDPIRIFSSQQEAVETSKMIIRDIQKIWSEARINNVLVFISSMLLALAISSIFAENREQFAILTVIGFALLMTLSYQTFPGFSAISTQDLLTGTYLVLFIFLAVLMMPLLLGEVKSQWGVSLIPALLIAVSYSVRNLNKRRLRTFLMLVSIVTMAMSLTSLTSTQSTVVINSFSVAKAWPADVAPYSIVKRSSGYLSYEDLYFIGSQKNISKIGYRMTNPVSYGALGFIGEVPVYGVLGIMGESPSFDMIKKASDEEVLSRLLSISNAVIISRHLAESENIDIGMTIVFKGVSLKVVGIFDGEIVSLIKEPDGSDFLPLYMSPGSQILQEVPGNNLLITNTYIAQELGYRISAVYCTFRENKQAKEASERLAFLGDYFIITMPSGEGLRYYFKGVSTEFFGASILIPIIITILNTVLFFYRAVHERRNEIFILSSIGLNPTHISLLFLVESIVLGFIGGGVGYIMSMIFFRVFGAFNIIVPVNVKTSVLDMSYIIVVMLSITMVSSIPFALKAAKITTPSLLRRWKIEGETVRGNTWVIRIPLRIPAEKIEMFVNHLYERLPQSSTMIELSISDVKREDKVDEAGNINYYISFKYGRSGNKPFNAYTTVELKKENEAYEAYVHTQPRSVYTYANKKIVHEVVSHVRRIVLEWSAAKLSIAMAIGNSIEQAFEIVKNYRPRILVLYSRTDIGNRARELRRRLRSEGIWPPAIEIRNFKTDNIHTLIEKLSKETTPLDAVCLESDDGLLSAALAIVASWQNKNILVTTSDGKIHEVPAKSLLESSA